MVEIGFSFNWKYLFIGMAVREWYDFDHDIACRDLFICLLPCCCVRVSVRKHTFDG